MMARGMTNQADIAAALGCTKMTVSNDMRWLERQWMKQHPEYVHKQKVRILQEIDEIIRESWAAWEKSKENAHKVVVKNGKDGEETTTSVEARYGDPNLLRVLKDTIDKKMDLLGLKVKKISATSPDGETTYHSQVIHEAMQLVEQARQGPQIIDGTVVEQMIEEAASKKLTHAHRQDADQPESGPEDKERVQCFDGHASGEDGGDHQRPAPLC